MVNISDIYTAIFEVTTTSIIRVAGKVKNKNSKYMMEVESPPIEMNIAHLKSNI